MITIQGKIPRDIYIAVSGGLDSMAALDFLRRNHMVSVLYFNHNTEYSNSTESLVKNFCLNNKINFISEKLKDNKPKNKSLEEFWRDQRYGFFNNFKDKKIITAHHLDDVVEWWIFSSINGLPKLIKYSRDNIIRPFLLTEKFELAAWCKNKQVPWAEDLSNCDIKFARNRIRHNIIPEILKINPGIKKNLKKILLKNSNYV